MYRVEDCRITASYFLDHPETWHVFCYPDRKDDFEVIGEFKSKEEAEEARSAMIAGGGRLIDWERVYG